MFSLGIRIDNEEKHTIINLKRFDKQIINTQERNSIVHLETEDEGLDKIDGFLNRTNIFRDLRRLELASEKAAWTVLSSPRSGCLC